MAGALDTGWGASYRRYLSLRREEDFTAAMEAAPEAVGQFLLMCREQQVSRAKERMPSLVATLPGGKDGEAGMTVNLAYLSQFAGLCDSFRQFEPSRWEDALRSGIEACELSLGISAELREPSCVAIYSSVLATGHQNAGENDKAVDLQTKAVELYRSLAREDPALYSPYLGKTLINLGNIQMDLGQLAVAYRTYHEAYLLYRRLDESEPGVYLPDVARTLNNLGNARSELRDLRTARGLFQQALAIYRQLAASEPDDYQPDVAMTWNNLGNTLNDLRELGAALDAFRESLPIYRKLADSDPSGCLPDVAMTLNNLGNTFRELRELPAAHGSFQEALGIYLQLAESQPRVYRPDAAMTLNNLGNTLNDLANYTAARDTFDGALAIYRQLAEDQPGFYDARIAGIFNNLGTTLGELGELAAARESYETALAMRRRLAESDPGIHSADVATTLNNLGALLNTLGEPAAARDSLRAARDMHRSHEMWVDAATPSANLGRIEKKGGNFALAISFFEDALADLHKGLHQIESPEHYDKFKVSFDDVAGSLIEIYSSQTAAEVSGSRLAGLFESLRRHDLLGEAAGDGARLLEAIQEGAGAAAGLLTQYRAAFLWIQVVENAVVFAIVRPGRAMTLGTAPRRWLALFETVLRQVRELVGSKDIEHLLEHPEEYRNSIPDLTLRRLMSEAFAMLPAEVRDLLRGGEATTIFVSPCRITVDFPFELLLADERFLGLRKLLVRVHGLHELAEVLERRPDALAGRRVLLGDPATGNPATPRLEFALQAAHRLAASMEQAGHPVEARYGEQATRQYALSELQDCNLGIMIFTGHGEVGWLALAGGERVDVADFDRIRWANAPYFHLDCCLAGANWGRGGGRFVGLPAALLRSGASAVLANFHLVYQGPAADFTMELYAAIWNRSTTLGEALLEACQAVDRRYGGNPLLWAASMLWGNPFVVLASPMIKNG